MVGGKLTLSVRSCSNLTRMGLPEQCLGYCHTYFLIRLTSDVLQVLKPWMIGGPVKKWSALGGSHREDELEHMSSRSQ
jgi:hypothetical protein